MTSSTERAATALALALGLVAWPAPAAPADGASCNPPHRRTHAAIRADDLLARIAALADDCFEGRGPGTPAGEASAAWIAAEMERIGLAPGAAGSWFQEVPAVTITLDPAASSLAFEGPGDAGPLRPAFGDEAVYWTRHAAAEDEAVRAAPLVFVGYGVTAPEEGWDDYAGVDVKGKAVLVMINDPGFLTGDPSLFRGKALTYYGRWTYKFEEAARRGAAAVLIVHETEPAAYGWRVVRNSNVGAKSHLAEPGQGMDRAALEGWITADVARALLHRAGLDYQALRLAANQRGFRPVPLEGVTLTAALHSSIQPVRTRNVVGMLRGARRPAETVLYAAHWDHLGVKPGAPGPDKIYNGAVDNASGVAGMLELAERFSRGPRLDRSLAFVSFTLEEQGLLGSEYFAAHPTVPLHRVVGGSNFDGLHPQGRSRDLVVVPFRASGLEGLLASALAAQGRVLAPDPEPEKGTLYRSDQFSLARRGVPLLYTRGGYDLRAGGKAAGQAVRDRYLAERYHQPSDEVDPRWDLSGPLEDLEAHYQVGRRLAGGTAWPNWRQGSEFRAARDRSLAERS